MSATAERLTLAAPAARRSSPSPLSAYGCAVLLVWGVIPFGAVHDWALWPLMAAAIAFAFAGVSSASARRTRVTVVAVTPVLAAIGVQALPLPGGVVEATGSGIGEFLTSYDVGFAADARSLYELSIAPVLTLRAAAIVAALAALVWGLDAQLTRRPDTCRRIAVAIAIVALPIALFALIQKATFNGRIYWFWESAFRASSNYYGPFVNRNHFAGWMLLASAVTGGLLIGQIQTIGNRVKPGWRNRVLWLSSEQASRVLITAAALLVMLISTMWSMSRSGMLGTTLALTILGAAALRHLGRGSRRVIAAASVVLLLLLAVTWRGTGTLANWYGRTQTLEWRVDLWQDTLPALRDFWFAGSGINTYSSLMLLYPQSDPNVHAAQAHSDYVQLAVEGGLLVGIPALILLGLVVREIVRRLKQPQDEMTWWIRMGAVAGISGMALQETVEFSLQIPGIAVLFSVLLAIAIHEAAPPASQPKTAMVRRLQNAGARHVLTATRDQLDLRDQAAVNYWFRANRPDYVYLVAGTVGGIMANSTRPAEFIYDNMMIHATVVHAAHQFGVKKLLYLGSSCIYPRNCPQPMREEHLLSGELEPTNAAYAIAKIAGIKLCEAYRKQYGSDFISAMPTNLYGPNDNFDLTSSHVLPAMIRKFHDAKLSGQREVTIWGTGTPKREFLHVDDLADACVYLMDHYDGAQHINVGTGVDLSIRELAETTRDIVYPDAELVFDTSKPDGTPRKLLDVSKLHDLGWKHRINLREGIESTYRWFLENPAQLRLEVGAGQPLGAGK